MSGISDLIVVALGSGAAASTALGALRTWVSSRSSSVNLKIESRGRVVELRADTRSTEVQAILERLLADLSADSETNHEQRKTNDRATEGDSGVVQEDDGSELVALDLAVSDPAQASHLRDWIRDQSGVRAIAKSGTPGPGELGALAVLTILASSSGVVTAIKTLPAFLRSRRSGLRIETTYRGEPFVLDATNVDDVLPLLERLLDD